MNAKYIVFGARNFRIIPHIRLRIYNIHIVKLAIDTPPKSIKGFGINKRSIGNKRNNTILTEAIACPPKETGIHIVDNNLILGGSLFDVGFLNGFINPFVEAICIALVEKKVRLTNRITAALKGYYPQVLDWFEDNDTQVFCDFLRHYPSLQAAQAAPKQELEQFFKTHQVVQSKTIHRRLEQIEQGVVLTEDRGIVEPLQLLVATLIAQMQVLLPSIATFDARIEQLFEAHPDAELFAALPGARPQLAPRLLVAFGEERDRHQRAQNLLRYSGIAPVQESSGQKSWVHWRWSCPKFLRQTFVEWALQTRKHSFWAEAFYQMQRQKGKMHQGAIRALAFKWIRIVFRCWQERAPYDEVKYLMALNRKDSPLVKNLAITGKVK